MPAITLAFVLRFFVEWCLALTAFWMTRVGAINQTYFVAMLFLSGQVAPLGLMPGWVQTIASVSPFRWMISFPLELLLGRVSPIEAAQGFGAQVIWIALAWGIMRWVWRVGVRAYSAVGG